MRLNNRVKKKLLHSIKKKAFYQSLLKDNETLAHEKHTLEKYVSNNKDLLSYRWFAKPGHFYSPLINEMNSFHKQLIKLRRPNFKKVDLPGIDLNTKVQLGTLKSLRNHVTELPNYSKPSNLRYFFGNDQFGKTDGTVLFTMLRHIKPKKIIEVGSGWSSAIMLDINELFPKDAARLTFIDPFPKRLFSILKSEDKRKATIITKDVQQVDVKKFKELRKNDILFIDNSHVSKSGSDVNHLFFKILPLLNKGVVIHIHDAFYPFEYPYEWVVEEKRNWNEVYVLRSFLINNARYEIMFWQSYLSAVHGKKLNSILPEAAELGASIWLRKTS